MSNTQFDITLKKKMVATTQKGKMLGYFYVCFKGAKFSLGY